jgi:tetratricopeptide (TPR) repeat protein
MLASIDFYLANSYYFQSNLEQAEEDVKRARDRAVELYRTAINLTSPGGEPLFVEPLNNLGFLLIEKGDVDKAIEPLQQASALCRKMREDQDYFCAAVKHNLGNAKRGQKKFQEAVDIYNSAIAGLERSGQSQSDARYIYQLSDLHQNIAYCYVKIADNFDDPRSEEYYEKAKQELDKARSYLNHSTGQDIQQRLYNNDLTRARIHIAHKQWQAVIDLLESMKDKTNNPNADLLLSIAYDCRDWQSDSEKSKSSLSSYTYKVMPKNQVEWDEGQEYYDEITKQCHP